MARRRRPEEHENHERWLVSYADFITLLFAFFVVMYSISSVNEGKYKILSEALVGVFNEPERSMKPIPIGEQRPLSVKPAEPLVKDSEQVDAGIGQNVTDPLKEIADEVRDGFGDLIKSNQMTVRGNELWIEIELSSGLLFGSGDAIPSDKAFTIIEKVAKILKPFDNPVHVEGFTDDQPISTSQFPTNWELSSARSSSIVRMLAMEGLNPARMASVGYGEFQPVASNATAEGRGRNRRVVLVISRNLDVRRSLTASGSANAQPDAALRRAGTQTAPAPVNPAVRSNTVNSSSPVR
ncbi:MULTISPECIES: flagellar motor protein MotD [Pseudomonas]|uniref:Flagellar motor protein MotD n=1 Tax=Pseudomonas phytophila TaxID=2867264 RepID=A0ABY6FAB4_9PSED|nr:MULTISPECIES: flagellar motor protein MotD [Pseudomonas]MCQ2997827.1 flagellar motor protein MotD [Pseudomonas syringae]RMR09058.1 Flagellar motor protein MotD [Pseudomonas savastanoi pv. glycinea]MCD5973441.1 flagellar motor protein MotD [Pseudomonas quasicaspiana]MCD5979290.1 flagellar motor protein MotD [Pseudomonas quasicaspiana]MCD5990572.1 flagellar motor protein MotD [Pseudomonas quasicaspiana]